MSISTRALPGTTIEPLYPDTDGEPMGEGAFHLAAFLHLCGALFRFFGDRSDVYVAGDMFLYYEEGNPDSKKAPDVMVAKGVRGNHPRRSFRTWEEGVVPAVVFEIVSRRTEDEDRSAKKAEYARIGVREYFLFDPEGISPQPRLQGFRLRQGRYQSLPLDAAGQLASRELELNLHVEGQLLRLIDARTGERLKTDRELQDEATSQKRRADEETRRAEEQARRVEEQTRRTEEQTRRAEEQTRRANELAAELVRLRASLPPTDSN
jgi:Uma2 family endonuclease